MHPVLYVAACLIIPALWGVMSHYAFGFIDRRRRRAGEKVELPPVDYSI